MSQLTIDFSWLSVSDHSDPLSPIKHLQASVSHYKVNKYLRDVGETLITKRVQVQKKKKTEVEAITKMLLLLFRVPANLFTGTTLKLLCIHL